jgi:hypothetical protein
MEAAQREAVRLGAVGAEKFFRDLFLRIDKQGEIDLGALEYLMLRPTRPNRTVRKR